MCNPEIVPRITNKRRELLIPNTRSTISKQVHLIPQPSQLRRRNSSNSTAERVTSNNSPICRICSLQRFVGRQNCWEPFQEGLMKSCVGFATTAVLGHILEHNLHICEPVLDGLATAEGDHNALCCVVAGDNSCGISVLSAVEIVSR